MTLPKCQRTAEQYHIFILMRPWTNQSDNMADQSIRSCTSCQCIGRRACDTWKAHFDNGTRCCTHHHTCHEDNPVLTRNTHRHFNWDVITRNVTATLQCKRWQLQQLRN